MQDKQLGATMIRDELRKAALVAAGLLLLAGCNGEAPGAADTGAPDTAAAEEARVSDRASSTDTQWVDLFNGENLDGWRSYGGGAPNEAWVVEDGVLFLDVGADTEEMTGGDLITEDQYENFELELEWKISEGGNSGIFYGVREIEGQDVAYETGIEMQILDNDRHVDGKVPETSAGACYALYPPTRDAHRPVGEYNKVRLVVDDGHAEHWLNGQKIVEYEIGSDDWNRRIAESKFADWEHFAKYRKGHIGLQDHKDPVWFRNIRIRNLP
jgi:hypothetical protein